MGAGIPFSATAPPRQADPVARMAKGAITTGEQDDLHPGRSLYQSFCHQVEAGRVR